MMTVETLEEHIAELDNASFSKLRDWFLELDQSRWDKQIEVDSNAGQLDFLINAALDEHQSGKNERPLKHKTATSFWIGYEKLPPDIRGFADKNFQLSN